MIQELKAIQTSEYKQGWYVGYIFTNIVLEVAPNLVSGGAATAVRWLAKSAYLAKLAPKFGKFGLAFMKALDRIADFIKVDGKIVRGADGAASYVDDSPKLGNVLSKTRMCFVAGTLVHTSTGLKAIEDIHPGELVLSRDQATGAQGWKPVLQTFTTFPDALYNLRYGVDADANGTCAGSA